MHIAQDDEAKTIRVIRYRVFEFLVMPFSLNNAYVTFCTFINKLFKKYLDKFMVVYLDDIIVYSQTLEVHVKHFRIIFKILKRKVQVMAKWIKQRCRP